MEKKLEEMGNKRIKLKLGHPELFGIYHVVSQKQRPWLPKTAADKLRASRPFAKEFSCRMSYTREPHPRQGKRPSLALSGLYRHVFHGKAPQLVTTCCLSSIDAFTTASRLLLVLKPPSPFTVLVATILRH